MTPHAHRRAQVTIDLAIDAGDWNRIADAGAIVQQAIETAARDADGDDGEVAILLTDDTAIRTLNRQWRGMDKPTNVLSFPAAEGAGDHLGDIAIALETLIREAEQEGKLPAHHLAHLAVHGYLHLVGYDHENEEDAQAMERLEAAILARLGISDPYIENEALLNSHA